VVEPPEHPFAQLKDYAPNQTRRSAQRGHFPPASPPDFPAQRAVNPRRANCRIQPLHDKSLLFGQRSQIDFIEQHQVSRGIEVQPGGAEMLMAEAGSVGRDNDEFATRFEDAETLAQQRRRVMDMLDHVC
jgi:hypothetical protein